MRAQRFECISCGGNLVASRFYKAENKRGLNAKCIDCINYYRRERNGRRGKTEGDDRKRPKPLFVNGKARVALKERPCLGYCGEYFLRFSSGSGHRCNKCYLKSLEMRERSGRVRYA